jgi:trehalose utilization protein
MASPSGDVFDAGARDEIVERVKRRVLEGMGLIVLHSGHYAKIFKALMGTTCSLKWREANDKERVWNLIPAHPIAQGIGDAVLYYGREVRHHRETLKSSDYSSSWFFFYVHENFQGSLD